MAAACGGGGGGGDKRGVSHSVPIHGLSQDDVEKWKYAVDSFLLHGKTAETVRNLARLFKGDKGYGMLASLVVLQSTFGNSSKFKHKLSVMEVILFSKKVAMSLYNRLKDQKHESKLEEVFLDCKQRLAVLLEEECGCVDCQRLVSVLMRAGQFMRPPNLNPHHKHSQAATMLTWIYNQVVLNLNVAILEEQIEVLFLGPDEFADFSQDMRDELSLLTSCLYFCWLYFILHYYVHMELNIIQEHIGDVCQNLGLPSVNSLGQVQRLAGSLPSRLLSRESFLHEVPRDMVHYDPLAELYSHMTREYTLTPQTVSKISRLVPRKPSRAQREAVARRLRIGRLSHRPAQPSQPPPHHPPRSTTQRPDEVTPLSGRMSGLSLSEAARPHESHAFPAGESGLEVEEEEEEEFELQISDDEEEGEGDDDEAEEPVDNEGIGGKGGTGKEEVCQGGGNGDEENREETVEEIELEISDSDDEEEGASEKQDKYGEEQGAAGGDSGDEAPFYELKEFERLLSGGDNRPDDEPARDEGGGEKARPKKSKRSKILSKSGYFREEM
nr:tegument protein G48 [Equid gammaherpesvirus 5]UTK45554.1 tegument protein G48 [Equid gammaherpesvirus 5]UTK45632.1 tegument protein G48 [Equid gammaherpesvirus 5]UTK45711.1 tegument protein G48 [Equid gammaherpesvirus 5]